MKKTYDCVAMKDAIHARMRKQCKGMTDAQQSASVRRWLATADDPLARWWRKTETHMSAINGYTRKAA